MRKRITYALLVPFGAAALAMAAAGNEDGTTVVQDADVAAETSPPVDGQPIPPEIAEQMKKAAAARSGGGKSDDFPKFELVAKDYTKVISTTDGKKPLYTLWTREKDAQMLAELPRNFQSQLLFFAYTVAGGTTTSGVQTGDMYATWKRYDKRLALIEPNFAVRTTGDLESSKGRERVFTDRVILDVPIVTMGPGGGPVVDFDNLLLGPAAARAFGFMAAGANPRLARIAKAKAFPENVEIAYELPLNGGRFGTLHYSISVLPRSTGYKPRVADARIGYFTTTYRDIGHPGKDTPWVRRINRWKLEKADRKLKVSPPKEPIVFYLEHTVPVRYRRWVRDGVLEWNKAFEKVGIFNAIEVYQQDARTGAHMEKDPEDARFDFVLWTNAGMGFAIGPSRVDPRTGQILDADIVMDEGFITSWVNAWKKTIPEIAMRNFGPETLAWLRTRPQWDPRVRLAAPAERPFKIRQLAMASDQGPYAGHPAAATDPTLMGDDVYDGLTGRISQVNGRCEYGMSAALELALFRLAPDLITELAEGLGAPPKADDDDEVDDDEVDDDEVDDDDDEVDDDEVDDDESDDDEGDDDESDDDEGDDDEGDDDEGDDDEGDDDATRVADGQMLDGVPEWFIGPLLKSVVMHEVGHTLGLRHNFKASCAHSLEEINSEAMKGQAITGSVMDYNPININVEDGETQGEYTMVTIGPYDYWAIEYGYTFDKKLDPILSRAAEPDLIYGTDEDSFGSDPRARVFDMGENPMDYADSQMRLVDHLRAKILDRMVKDGDSWAKAREGYEMLLGKHFAAVGIAANWVGGVYSNRDRKGDPGDREPVTPVEAEQQRRAFDFVVNNAFRDDAFGLSPELLSKMSVDKWWDDGGFGSIFEDPAWPVHDRILAIQAGALTMLMNPTTLNRVYDSEFRIDADEDALTLPDILWGVSDEVWSELEKTSSGRFTARNPMISSLRRNLQREHLERLIDLSLPNDGFGVAAKPVANLSVYKLREIEEKIGRLVDKRGSRLDPYTLAHLAEAKVRIAKALDAQYIYNTDDIGGGGGFGMPFFLMEDGGGR